MFHGMPLFRRSTRSTRWAALAVLVACASSLIVLPAYATDVNGIGDCGRQVNDWGDAPEGFDAYPGVLGRFPTCSAPFPAGAQEIAAGCAAMSPAPFGSSGAVRHRSGPMPGVWLGCTPGFGDGGIDRENDGKTSPGGGPSMCGGMNTDCIESFSGLSFGQDECTGDNDAGLGTTLVLDACTQGSFAVQTYNCGPAVEMYVNILVDWNRDGDWNDVVACPGGGCVAEWAVRNVQVGVASGCQSTLLPSFPVGPTAGVSWMRISISFDPATLEYPWAGTDFMPAQSFEGGETEDYPIEIRAQGDPCPTSRDFGDAPEGITAYGSGVTGNFPTCQQSGGVGTRTVASGCTALSTAPGPTGYVEHVSGPGNPGRFWLGCSATGVSIDSEADGKTSIAAGVSACNPVVPTDCIGVSPWGINYGQDECVGDSDAGISGALVFQACTETSFQFRATNCRTTPQAVVLNVLIDWNEDGDWNDMVACTVPGALPRCAPEWVAKNVTLVLLPGCGIYTVPLFRTGPNAGGAWVRISISEDPVSDDFPWAGTASTGIALKGGETEDYPAVIRPQGGECVTYADFGDAPEEMPAYPGVNAHFPTCSRPGSPGTQELLPSCAAPGTPPGATGAVVHVSDLSTPARFWLGCGQPEAVEGELDGKVSIGGGGSLCNVNVNTDCLEPAPWGISYGQDECYGDSDAGVASPLVFQPCAQSTFTFTAYNCRGVNQVAFLNVLVDWNRDGDWNDVVACTDVTGLPVCAPEWVARNVTIALVPGCNSVTVPSFRAGPNAGGTWVRLTISENAANNDFPWAGSETSGALLSGETEDYPAVIVPQGTDAGSGAGTPDGAWLAAPTPNPSSGGFTLRFGLPREGAVALGVYDVAGRLVRTLERGSRVAGPHVVGWDGRDDSGALAPAGVYILRLDAEGQTLTQRAVRVK